MTSPQTRLLYHVLFPSPAHLIRVTFLVPDPIQRVDGSIIMSDDAIDFHEANFVPLPEQSNVYGLVHLDIGGQNKLVVATVRAQILCFEYQKDPVRPLLSPINFTYIPGTLSPS